MATSPPVNLSLKDNVVIAHSPSPFRLRVVGIERAAPVKRKKKSKKDDDTDSSDDEAVTLAYAARDEVTAYQHATLPVHVAFAFCLPAGSSVSLEVLSAPTVGAPPQRLSAHKVTVGQGAFEDPVLSACFLRPNVHEALFAQFGESALVQCCRAGPKDFLLSLRQAPPPGQPPAATPVQNPATDAKLWKRFMAASFGVPAHHYANLFRVGLFIFPQSEDPGNPLMFMPNGRKRFCVDLDAVGDATVWLRDRKMRGQLHASVGTASSPAASPATSPATGSSPLVMTVDDDYAGALEAAAVYHRAVHNSTWLSDGLIGDFVRFFERGKQLDATGPPRADDELGGVRLHCFELWDAPEGPEGPRRRVACTLGFSLGRVYHDYTMATPVRDTRSAGSMLTKLTAAVLKECGYSLWYWGNRLGYMTSFEGGYGGVDLGRDAFLDRWLAQRDALPTTHVGRMAAAPAPKELICGLLARREAASKQAQSKKKPRATAAE